MNFPTVKLSAWAAGITILLSLAACGSGSSTTPEGDTLSGLAAVGAPLAGATVALRCANGVSGETSTDDKGEWSIELVGPEFPCLATLSNARSHPGVTLRSLALEDGHLNITPLTDLVLARAIEDDPSALDKMSGADLRKLGDALPAAQDKVIEILVAQGFEAGSLVIFTGKFEAAHGDPYDDVLEHIAVSLSDGGQTYEDLLTAIADTSNDTLPALPNTQVFNAAALAAMPQINKASLAIENGALKMALGSGNNPVGAFVGSGAGNKAVLQLGGLNGMKLRDLHSISIELQGDAAGVSKTPGAPYVAVNLTIDLQCNTEALPADYTLNQLRERRRILSFDTFYQFMQATQTLSSEELTTIQITPATRGWRVSGGSPIGTVALSPDYNGSENLTGFDYTTYPDACIVDSATGDGGMHRDTDEPGCASGNALDGTAPAACGLAYKGGLIFLGSSSATQASNWLVKELKVMRQDVSGDTPSDVTTLRTYRFE